MNLSNKIRDKLWLRYRDLYFKMNNDDNKEAFYYLVDDMMAITTRHIMDG